MLEGKTESAENTLPSTFIKGKEGKLLTLQDRPGKGEEGIIFGSHSAAILARYHKKLLFTSQIRELRAVLKTTR